MNEGKFLTCPNCGANITNTQNCEYCGSLLVRFVDKGIDLSNTSYLNNANTSLPLVKALKQNIKMQKTSMDTIATDIYYKNNRKQYDCLASVLRSGSAVFGDDSAIPSESNTGLCVIISFNDVENEIEARQQHSIFKKLDCFLLFDEHISLVTALGYKVGQTMGYTYKRHEY